MAVQNSLARQDQSMKLSVYLQNDAVKKQINQVVGGKNGTRFISSIVSAVQSTPALQECTSPSIVNAALLGEALNLSPSPQLGQFYMVPFDNKKKGCKEAQFQLGYKGYIQLAIRSGYYKKLNVLAAGIRKYRTRSTLRLPENQMSRSHRKFLPVNGAMETTERIVYQLPDMTTIRFRIS